LQRPGRQRGCGHLSINLSGLLLWAFTLTMKRKRKSPAASQQPDQPVCPKCLQPLVRDEHFCPQCGVPLAVQATTNPYDQILAEGYAYREASSHPYKPIIVAGMWLLWGPCFLSLVAVDIYIVANIPAIIREAQQMWGFENYVIALVFAAILAFGSWMSGAILLKTTRNYLRQRDE
jgi:hypothetical protein